MHYKALSCSVFNLLYMHFLCCNFKVHTDKTNRITDIENKLVLPVGSWGRGEIGVGE